MSQQVLRRITIVLLLFSISSFAFLQIHEPARSQEDPRFIASIDGLVQVARAFDISADIGRRIYRVHFVEGQLVKKGDLLLELDKTFIELDAETAELNVKRAEALHMLAQEKLDRLEKLKGKDTISEADYLVAVHNAEIAAVDLALAKVKVERAKAILDAHRVYAPFSGQMSAPIIRDGGRVTTKMDGALATIYDLDPIHVRFSVSYERILATQRSVASRADLTNRITLKLSLPDGSEYEPEGRIIGTTFNVDPATNMGTLLVEFPNPDYILRPGLRVKANAYWIDPPQ